MGESGAYQLLPHSFPPPPPPCQSPPRFHEGYQEVLRALGDSISLGRYMSESLDWGKYSAFSQNRYVEEAERCSVPGSVARMKAHFEARYKTRAQMKKLPTTAAAAATTTATATATAAATATFELVATAQMKKPPPTTATFELEATQETSSHHLPPNVLQENTSLNVPEYYFYTRGTQIQSNKKAAKDGSSENPHSAGINRCYKHVKASRAVADSPLQQHSSSRVSIRSDPRAFSSAPKLVDKGAVEGTSPAVPASGTRNSLTSTPELLIPSTSRVSSKGILRNSIATPQSQSSTRTRTNNNEPCTGTSNKDKKLISASTENSKSTASYCPRTPSSTTFSPFSFKCEERAAKRAEFFQKQQQREAEKIKFPPEQKHKIQSKRGKTTTKHKLQVQHAAFQQ